MEEGKAGQSAGKQHLYFVAFEGNAGGVDQAIAQEQRLLVHHVLSLVHRFPSPTRACLLARQLVPVDAIALVEMDLAAKVRRIHK
jgi:hypothetical protein